MSAFLGVYEQYSLIPSLCLGCFEESVMQIEVVAEYPS